MRTTRLLKRIWRASCPALKLALGQRANEFFSPNISECRDIYACLTNAAHGTRTQIQEKIMTITVIKPQELARLCKEGKKIDLIDVRTPVEFREVHVETARNVPLDRLDAAAVMQARNRSANEPLYVICRSGGRGQQACERFFKAGFSNVVNVEGGTMACLEAGLPVVRGKKVISLERQV